jgi:hypothetical protein
MIMNQLSGGTFNEKPVEEKKSVSQSWQRSRFLVSDGPEWEAGSDQVINNIGQKLRLKQSPEDSSMHFWTD